MKNEFLKKHIITEVVIGMGDGLIVPFALAAGLSGMAQSNQVIVAAGLAAVAAGSITMGFGGYYAARSTLQQGQPAKETPAGETHDVKAFLANLGLNEEMQNRAAEEITNDHKKWANLVTTYDLPDKRRPGMAGWNIGLSYALGGLVPLCSYFFSSSPINGLKISAVLTTLSLLIFGYFKSKASGFNAAGGAVRTALVGLIAGGGAFAVARLFNP